MYIIVRITLHACIDMFIIDLMSPLQYKLYKKKHLSSIFTINAKYLEIPLQKIIL